MPNFVALNQVFFINRLIDIFVLLIHSKYMLQRIQTLFLLLAIVCSVLLLFFPSLMQVPKAGITGDSYSISVLKTEVISGGISKELMTNWPLLITNAIIILLYILTIIGFRKRLQQVKLCNFTLLFQTGLILLLLYQGNSVANIAGGDYTASPGLGLAFISLSILLVFAARYYILKDEALVRSADRLR